MILDPEQQDWIEYANVNPVEVEGLGVVTLISKRIVGQRRWSLDVEVTFTLDGVPWQFVYDEPATEMQDFEMEDVEAYRVFPREVTTTIYEKEAPAS